MGQHQSVAGLTLRDNAEALKGKSLAELLCAYCDRDDAEAQDELLDVYEACRPSEGYLALYVNGEKVIGSHKQEPDCKSLPVEANGDKTCPEQSMNALLRTQAWTYGHSQFDGITTRCQTCPNYLKIGHYALQYNYEKIAESSKGWSNPSDVLSLDTEFDFARFASTRRLAEDSTLTEFQERN